MKTIAQAHNELLVAIAILEEIETDAENARKKREMRMLDIHEARIKQAESQVVEAAKDFVHYLSEACIKF